MLKDISVDYVVDKILSTEEYRKKIHERWLVMFELCVFCFFLYGPVSVLKGGKKHNSDSSAQK